MYIKWFVIRLHIYTKWIKSSVNNNESSQWTRGNALPMVQRDALWSSGHYSQCSSKRLCLLKPFSGLTLYRFNTSFLFRNQDLFVTHLSMSNCLYSPFRCSALNYWFAFQLLFINPYVKWFLKDLHYEWIKTECFLNTIRTRNNYSSHIHS